MKCGDFFTSLQCSSLSCLCPQARSPAQPSQRSASTHDAQIEPGQASFRSELQCHWCPGSWYDSIRPPLLVNLLIRRRCADILLRPAGPLAALNLRLSCEADNVAQKPSEPSSVSPEVDLRRSLGTWRWRLDQVALSVALREDCVVREESYVLQELEGDV